MSYAIPINVRKSALLGLHLVKEDRYMCRSDALELAFKLVYDETVDIFILLRMGIIFQDIDSLGWKEVRQLLRNKTYCGGHKNCYVRGISLLLIGGKHGFDWINLVNAKLEKQLEKTPITSILDWMKDDNTLNGKMEGFKQYREILPNI
jgi:hypothetical protein